MDNEDEESKLEEMAREEMRRRFSEADEKYMGMIEDYVAGGFCETLARLAVYLGKERADRALGKLPEEIRAGVEQQVGALGDKACRTDLKNCLEVEHVFKKAGVSSEEMADSVIDGAGQKVLATLYKEIGTLFTHNPVLVESIEEHMVLFEDIVYLDDLSTQKLLRVIDTMTLAMAFRGKNTEAVQEKIFRNMSKRAVEMLKEDMEFMGPVRIRDVLSAQNKILGTIIRYNRAGEINVTKFEKEAAT